MNKETPQIGHMLFDRYGSLGMVICSDYIWETNLYLVEIEWIIGKFFLREVYRVGAGNGNVGESFMKLSDYAAMRHAYENLRKANSGS